jgi:hypothetical protein
VKSVSDFRIKTNSLGKQPSKKTMNPHDITTKKAYEAAKEEATPLNLLINPKDVSDGVDNWSEIDGETLKREIWESVEIIMMENQEPFAWYVHDLSIKLHRDSMPRISMDKLATNDSETAIKWGVWPNSMDKWTVTQIIEENYRETVHHDTIREASEIVEKGIFDGMWPENTENPFEGY